MVIVDHDAGWPRRYRAERARVAEALGESAIDIEHIGSTAVPGLAAKPVVDMMVGMSGRAAADDALPRLAAIGYTDVSPGDGHPGWYYCIGSGAKPHDVHLHLVRHGGNFWERHLLFRDYLRGHPDTAAEYGRLKRRLAEQYGADRQGYCDAKTGFVRSVEVRARGLAVRPMTGDDVGPMFETFRRRGRERIRYQRYLLQQREGGRVVLVAAGPSGPVAGYCALVWRPRYEPFRAAGTPEVVDLNVIEEWQRKGVGTALVHEADRRARERGARVLGISVVRDPDYRAAAELYRRLGFAPDGRGPTPGDNELHLEKPLA